jgi:hypothetical protein
MSISFTIPRKLVHFRPLFEWFSEIPKDDLHEDTDMSTVDLFLQSRYGNRDPADVECRWNADRNALGELIEVHGKSNSWLYFLQAYAFLTPHLLSEVLERIDENDTDQPPPLTLRVDLPGDFQVKHDYGSVLASNESMNVSFVPTGVPVLEFKLNNLRLDANRAAERNKRPDWLERVDYAFQKSDWGPVSGTKVTRHSQPPHSGKEITYLLEVPGGACFIQARCKNVAIDGSELEKYLHTISVESNL